MNDRKNQEQLHQNINKIATRISTYSIELSTDSTEILSTICSEILLRLSAWSQLNGTIFDLSFTNTIFKNIGFSKKGKGNCKESTYLQRRFYLPFSGPTYMWLCCDLTENLLKLYLIECILSLTFPAYYLEQATMFRRLIKLSGYIYIYSWWNSTP